MNLNFSLSIPLMIASLVLQLSCNEPVKETSAIFSDEMKEFELKFPAKVIRELSLSYVDSAGIFTDSVVLFSSDNYHFDSGGHLMRGERWNIPANKHYIETWVYDSLGRKLNYTFERGKSCSQTANYFYDVQGILIRKEIFSALDSLMNVEIYKYNAQRQLTQKEVQGVIMACGYELPNKSIYEYDQNGRASRTRSYSENRNTDQIHTYVGDTTFTYAFGQDYRSGSIFIKSNYDSKGAWTKSTFVYKLDDGRKQVFETTRTIEYY